MAPSVLHPSPPTPPATDEIPASKTGNVKGLSEEFIAHKVKHHVEDFDQFKEHSVPFNPQYALTPRKLRIITIGAGFSGLLIAHKFQHRFPELQEFVEHTIFEGRSDLGGTWLVNTYPGVQCDVPSHIYVRVFAALDYI